MPPARGIIYIEAAPRPPPACNVMLRPPLHAAAAAAAALHVGALIKWPQGACHGPCSSGLKTLFLTFRKAYLPCMHPQDRFLVEALAVGPEVLAATSELFKSRAADVRCASCVVLCRLSWVARGCNQRASACRCWIVLLLTSMHRCKKADTPGLADPFCQLFYSAHAPHVQWHQAEGGAAGAKKQGRQRWRQHPRRPACAAAHAAGGSRRLGS